MLANKKRYELILFDVDGTILDTSQGIWSAFLEAVDRLRLAMPQGADLHSVIGPPIQNTFSSMFGLNAERANQCAAVFRDIYKNKTLLQARVYPGMTELLTALRQDGRKIAVATYKREDYALMLLKHFSIDRYVDVIHGADMAGKLTKRDLILQCMQECDVKDVQRAVMVGDTDSDLAAAQAIGMDFLAVTYGFGYTARRRCADAIANADSPQSIVDYLL